MTQESPASGLLLIDKPAGLTSHDVVAKLRKALGTRRVGHAGTLDPMATGLLVVGVNAGTKLLNYLVGADKTYLATIRLGWATTTDDAEGDPLAPSPNAAAALADTSNQALLDALLGFQGDQLQVPSSVSAIRVDGKRAYDLVRAGEEVTLAARPVTITDVEALQPPERHPELGCIDITVSITCSSGTYIRAIARDLGAQLGVGGHLTSLRRTRVGTFDITSATELDRPALIGLAEAAGQIMPVYTITETEAGELRHGRRIGLAETTPPAALFAAIDNQQRLVAVVAAEGEQLQPRWVVTER